MAANLGSMVASLTVQTRPFDSGLKRSAGQLNRFGNHVKTNTANLKRMAGTALKTVGAFLGFRAVVNIFNEARAAIDKVTKAARGLGMSAQALEQWQHAASLAGVSQETMVKAFNKLPFVIGQAQQGLATYQRAFKLLGLDANQLANLSPAEQMKELAAAISQIQNPTDRAALVMQLFGSRIGAELIPLLMQTTEELQAQFNEWDELAGIIGGVGRKAVEDYNDSLTKLDAIWQGLKRALTVTLATALTPIVNTFIDWRRALNDLDPRLAAIITGTLKFVAAMTGLIVAYRLFALTLKAVNVLLDAQLIKKLALLAVANPFMAALVGFTGLFVSIGLAMDDGKKAAKDLGKEIENETQKMLSAIGAATQLAAKMDSLRAAAESLKQTLRTPFEIFRDELTQLVELSTWIDDQTGLPFIDTDTFNRGIAAAVDKLAKALNLAQKIRDALKPVAAVRLGTMAEVEARHESERQVKAQGQYQNQILKLRQKANGMLAQIQANTAAQPPIANVQP